MTTDITHPADFEVDFLIARLSACDPDDIDLIEEIMSGTSAEVALAVGTRGGRQVRERLYAPSLASAERDGLIEWTGERDANGLKIWRTL